MGGVAEMGREINVGDSVGFGDLKSPKSPKSPTRRFNVGDSGGFGDLPVI